MNFEDDARITDADPAALAVDASMVPAMISGGNRNGLMGTGDMRPRVLRDGSQDALALPSRFGRMLRYRDGRVAFMGGQAEVL